MTRRQPRAQMLLFGDAPACRRAQKHEPLAIYERVVFLRRLGIKVRRAGRHCHFVDGRRMETAVLVQFADAKGFRPR